MSDMIVHEFVRAVVASFQDAGRPVGLPDDLIFVQRLRGEDKKRPCFIFGAEEVEWIHPRLVSFELVMNLETRSEDVVPDAGEGKGDEVAAWLGAVNEVFLNRVGGQVPGLNDKGIQLRYLFPGGSGEGEPDGGDGYAGSLRWRVRLQS